jgi:hypothetical protein
VGQRGFVEIREVSAPAGEDFGPEYEFSRLSVFGWDVHGLSERVAVA